MVIRTVMDDSEDSERPRAKNIERHAGGEHRQSHVHGREADIRVERDPLVEPVLNERSILGPWRAARHKILHQRPCDDHREIHKVGTEEIPVGHFPDHIRSPEENIDVAEIVDSPGPRDIGNPLINNRGEIVKVRGRTRCVPCVDRVVTERLEYDIPGNQQDTRHTAGSFCLPLRTSCGSHPVPSRIFGIGLLANRLPNIVLRFHRPACASRPAHPRLSVPAAGLCFVSSFRASPNPLRTFSICSSVCVAI